MAPSKPLALTINDWNVSAIKYMAPKVNDKGGKSINVISTQTNRALYISTPLMMTWGISDFVDEKTGESDGKFSMQLNFPNSEYSTSATDLFLQKLKDLENQILDDAVRNAELWFGEEMDRAVAKHSMYPILKYSKNKDTKKIDLTKPPSIRAKVPNYDNKWNVEIYDTKQNLLFPCDNSNLTPIDFVPKMSSVACLLQFGGIWIGGKGWGVTWKLSQCVVKPSEVMSVFGKCQIMLSNDELNVIEKQDIKDVPVEHDDDSSVAPVKAAVTSALVEDSDDDEPEQAPVQETKVEPEAKPVKKVVKKAAAEPEPAAAEPVAEVKKKVVKKKAA